MFDTLTNKLQSVFKGLSSKGKMTEENISSAVREVRMALLEADVNYGVAKAFIKRVKEKALGESVIKSVSPGEQFIKIIHDELVQLMGSGESEIHLKGNPAVVMVCGLQGSGKTTHCAKLANLFKKKNYNRRPMLVACDLQRPAAIDQLQKLGKQIDIPVFTIEGEKNPVKIAKKALKGASHQNCDLLILDTAGRLHIDDEMMKQLADIKKVTKPCEILFVANAATGQDAVKSASEFNSKIEVTGSILTMLDGDARGGASISVREVTGKPLKFEGVGERIDDIQIFNPTSMANRILGMGDTINLVKRAEEHFDEETSKEMEKKIRKASFTYADYLTQMASIKKMGPLKNLLKMIPGVSGSTKLLENSEGEFKKMEAIILSMTKKERLGLVDLAMSRRKRVARGSGTEVKDINKLVKSFKQAKQFLKKMPNKKMEKMAGMGNFPGM